MELADLPLLGTVWQRRHTSCLCCNYTHSFAFLFVDFGYILYRGFSYWDVFGVKKIPYFRSLSFIAKWLTAFCVLFQDCLSWCGLWGTWLLVSALESPFQRIYQNRTELVNFRVSFLRHSSLYSLFFLSVSHFSSDSFSIYFVFMSFLNSWIICLCVHCGWACS